MAQLETLEPRLHALAEKNTREDRSTKEATSRERPIAPADASSSPVHQPLSSEERQQIRSVLVNDSTWTVADGLAGLSIGPTAA